MFVEFGGFLRFYSYSYGFWSSFWLFFWTDLGITWMVTLTQNDNLPATKDMNHGLLGLVDEGCAPYQPSLAFGGTAT